MQRYHQRGRAEAGWVSLPSAYVINQINYEGGREWLREFARNGLGLSRNNSFSRGQRADLSQRQRPDRAEHERDRSYARGCRFR